MFNTTAIDLLYSLYIILQYTNNIFYLLKHYTKTIINKIQYIQKIIKKLSMLLMSFKMITSLNILILTYLF